jgi:hypothetical protein
VRLQPMGIPDALHRAQADAAGLRHRPAGPVGACPRGAEQVSASTFATVVAGTGALPGGRLLSRSKPSTPT